MTDYLGNEAQIRPSETEQEKWAVIAEFEDYEVSTFGRVRRIKTQEILKQAENKNGYYQVLLYREEDGFVEKQRKTRTVHRLVCKAFWGEPPEERPICDHIDRCRSNNYYLNLRWVNKRENYLNHKPYNRQKINKKKTPIIFYNRKGEFVKRYNSIMEAHEELGFSIISIDTNLRGTRKPFRTGYFKLAEENDAKA